MDNCKENDNKKNFYFISGLPRTGSTLLSSILYQNPLIHTEGNSALCQLMWDNYVSCFYNSKEQLLANNKFNLDKIIIGKLPFLYYENIERPIIIDKCRSWTLKDNINLIDKYITSDYKIIIMIRPIDEIIKSFDEIIKSFMKLYLKNKVYSEEKLLVPNSEPLMRSLNGVLYAKQNNINNNFIFIHYDDLISKPQFTLKKIYDFFGLEEFKHNFNNIINYFQENDAIYGLIGMHEIKSNIIKDDKINEIILPKKIINICNKINKDYKIIFDK